MSGSTKDRLGQREVLWLHDCTLIPVRIAVVAESIRVSRELDIFCKAFQRLWSSGYFSAIVGAIVKPVPIRILSNLARAGN